MSKSKVYKQHYSCMNAINAVQKNGEPYAFLFLLSQHRGPGKTYSVSKYLIEQALEKGDKFALLCRNVGDLGGLAKGVLSGYVENEIPNGVVREVMHQSKVYSNIYLDVKEGEETTSTHIGFCVCLRKADAIKRISSMFLDVKTLFFDEMLPSSKSDFLPGEIDKFFTLYKSIARGEGKAVRKIRTIFCSNTITLDNPYMIYTGLSSKVQDSTRWYTEGNVLYERCEVEGLAEMHDESDINRAFKKYVERIESNLWLNDDGSLVVSKKERNGWGRPYYLATLLYNKEYIGLYCYDKVGFTYVSRQYDKDCPDVYCVNIDGTPNISVLKTSSLIGGLKKDFFKGMVRCQDAELQGMLMELFA